MSSSVDRNDKIINNKKEPFNLAFKELHRLL